MALKVSFTHELTMKVSRFVSHYLVIIALKGKERGKGVRKMIKTSDN